MKKLEEIKKRVVEVFPEVMELKNGCVLEVVWVDGQEPEILVWSDRTDMRENGEGYLIEDNINGKIVKILGKPITLEHILEILGKKNSKLTEITDKEKYSIVNTNLARLLYNWEFTKPLDHLPQNLRQ